MFLCPLTNVRCDVLTGKVLEIYDGEVHIERPDGSRVVVIVNIAPLKDQRGEVIGSETVALLPSIFSDNLP